MKQPRGADNGVRSFAELLRVPHYLPIFCAAALSTWGDYVARVTVAAVIYERTGSTLATASTLAVSFVPSFLGRSLLAPFLDRFRYKRALVGAHLARAACVVGLLFLILGEADFKLILVVLAVLEAIGGAAIVPSTVMMTDLFEHDRPLYGKAVALSAMAEQGNQALGLAIGGSVVAVAGPRFGLLFDLATVLVAALVISLVIEVRPLLGERGKGVRGYVNDLRRAASDLAHHAVLARLVMLSAVSGLAIAAPEALAIPIAGGQGWGGPLMAAPILGAFIGVILIGRLDVHTQNSAILPVALTMPLPLLAVALHPPLVVVAALFALSGMFQAFMVPLQATFALTTEPKMRGRIYSLAGAVSVAASGASFLAAGWVGQHTSPHVGVSICAGVALGLILLVAYRWPHAHVSEAVDRAYAQSPTRRTRAA